MANVFREHVWVIDTPSANELTGDTPPSNLYLQAIRWVAPGAAAGSQAVVQNANGDVIWESFATGPNYVEESMVPLLVRGLIVPTLSTGQLFFYHLLLTQR